MTNTPKTPAQKPVTTPKAALKPPSNPSRPGPVEGLTPKPNEGNDRKIKTSTLTTPEEDQTCTPSPTFAARWTPSAAGSNPSSPSSVSATSPCNSATSTTRPPLSHPAPRNEALRSLCMMFPPAWERPGFRLGRGMELVQLLRALHLQQEDLARTPRGRLHPHPLGQERPPPARRPLGTPRSRLTKGEDFASGQVGRQTQFHSRLRKSYPDSENNRMTLSPSRIR